MDEVKFEFYVIMNYDHAVFEFYVIAPIAPVILGNKQ